MSDEMEETGAAAPPWPGERVAAKATAADFSRREFALRERMDEPCTFATYKAAAMDLAEVNALTRGYNATLDFLERVIARTGVRMEPLHVVDVGCGHGDGLRTIHRWAAKRSVPLRLTGVDVNPYAARLARECDRREHVDARTIEWVTADAFAVELELPADVVISSLFAHHLSDADIVKYLRWSEATARVGWMVSDLRRSERAAMLFGWMARGMRWHPMVEEDGRVSFRRALAVEEWRERVLEAGVDAVVGDAGWGRLRVERMKVGEAGSR